MYDNDDDPFGNHPPPLPLDQSATSTRSDASAAVEPVKVASASIFVEHLEAGTPSQEDMEVSLSLPPAQPLLLVSRQLMIPPSPCQQSRDTASNLGFCL